VFEAAVVGFDPVVFIPLDVVPRRRDQLVEDSWLDGCLVGDYLDRCKGRRAQRPVEEPAGRVGVAPVRYQDVDDLPMLVDRPVDATPDTVDLMSAAGSTFGQTRVG
jgi:hypothetical protein